MTKNLIVLISEERGSAETNVLCLSVAGSGFLPVRIIRLRLPYFLPYDNISYGCICFLILYRNKFLYLQS